MPAYITQSEAAVFADSLATMSAPKAMALLAAASSALDNYCGRTFIGTELSEDIKAGIAMMAEWLSTTNPTSGPITKEKIGDYDVEYAEPQTDGIPMAIQMLWAGYKIVAVG